ncbi:hypothetical protein DM02DRAFT_609637 [Periconia macrospinosa]|uniref:F-box domain-containing protein n=1 Tax=Periconia macrospinosa TaxID=97972 RepID=A0A2V1EBT7_9PLEO|nr:hypothetical protein DM02DRAFT_609637 [Periconia macrospinosa]
MSSSLLSFPNEILLDIASHLVNPFRSVQNDDLVEEGPTNYYRDLYNIALACRRFSTIAREVLLSDRVTVPFRKLDRLLETYIYYPHLALRTQRLDVVHGYRKTLNQVNDPFGWPRINSEFREACIRIIRGLEIDEGYKNDWIASLDYSTRRKVETGNDNILGYFAARNTFFGLLLVTLRNIKKLHLGTLYSTDIPVLADLLGDCQAKLANSTPTAVAWHSGYLRAAMLLVAPKLTHLEMPLQWIREHTCFGYQDIPVHRQVLKHFTNLDTLIISQRAFQAPGTGGGFVSSFSLPTSLKHITIVGDRYFALVQLLFRNLNYLQREDFGLQTMDVFQPHRVFEDERVDDSFISHPVYRMRLVSRDVNKLGIRFRVRFSKGNSVGQRVAIANYLRSREGSMEDEWMSE